MAEDHPDGNHEDDVSAATSMSQTTHGAERKTGQPKIQLDWNQWLALRAGSFELPACIPEHQAERIGVTGGGADYMQGCTMTHGSNKRAEPASLKWKKRLRQLQKDAAGQLC